MTHTVALASRASSGTQNKGTPQESCRTSHPFLCCFTGGGHSCRKFTTGVSDLIYRGPLPKTCPCTAQHNLRSHLRSVRSRSCQRFPAEVFRGLRISRLPQGGEQSLVSYRLFVTTVFSLLSFPFFWQRLSSPSFGPLGAQAPHARCTAQLHGRHRVGPVLHISGCISSPGAGALFSGFALHVFLLALCDVVFFEFAGGSIFPKKPESRSHSSG